MRSPAIALAPCDEGTKNARSGWTERMQPTPVREDDYRSPFEVDYARVIHSASFRRLGDKTQILSSSDGDFHRTRLTHSLEVSQVACGLLQHFLHTDDRAKVQAVLPDRILLETICLVHDLGHPPFGHGGEAALNYCMREHGGFEGNGQTLRILSKLEIFAEEHGSNLTRRTLLGIVKYPIPYSQARKTPPAPGVTSPINGQVLLDPKLHEPPKCYMDTEEDVIRWIYEPFSPWDVNAIFKNRAKSLDCTIMDLADDIAYGVHDLEDAISLGLVSAEQMTQDIDPALWGEFLDRMEARYPQDFTTLLRSRYEVFCGLLFSGDAAKTKRQIGRMVSYMIAQSVVHTRDYEDDLFRYEATLRPAAAQLLSALKNFIFERVIRSPQIRQIRFKGQQMIIQLFTYLNHDPRLLPTAVYEAYKNAEDDNAKQRTICDYLASMTDTSLMNAYKRFTSPGTGTAFDHL